MHQCVFKKVKLINHDCLPILMLLYIMLYIVLAYLMLLFISFISITIGDAQITSKQSVKNLGITLHCRLIMNAHENA